MSRIIVKVCSSNKTNSINGLKNFIITSWLQGLDLLVKSELTFMHRELVKFLIWLEEEKWKDLDSMEKN